MFDETQNGMKVSGSSSIRILIHIIYQNNEEADCIGTAFNLAMVINWSLIIPVLFTVRFS